MPDIQLVTFSKGDAVPCHVAWDAHIEPPGHVQLADNCDAALQLNRLLCRAQSGSQDCHVLALAGACKDCGNFCQLLPRMAEAGAAQVVQDRGPNCKTTQRPCVCEATETFVSMQLPAMRSPGISSDQAVLSTPVMSLTDVISGFTRHRLQSHEELDHSDKTSRPMSHMHAVHYQRR